MNEQEKNNLIDSMKSTEMRDFFENLIRSQIEEVFGRKIEEIKELFSQSSETDPTTAELKKSHTIISELKEENDHLAKQVRELETKNEHYEKLYEEQSRELEKTIQEKSHELKEIGEEITQLVNTLKKQEDELKIKDAEIEELSTKVNQYKEKYELPEQAFHEYQGLPDEIKKRINYMFGEGSFYSFISATCDRNNIEGLWTFIRIRIIEGDFEEIDPLQDLFKKIFTLFSQSDRGERYTLITPTIGEKFDSDKHSIKGIATDGRIERALLDGIYDTEMKKAVFKAVVQIQ